MGKKKKSGSWLPTGTSSWLPKGGGGKKKKEDLKSENDLLLNSEQKRAMPHSATNFEVRRSMETLTEEKSCVGTVMSACKAIPHKLHCMQRTPRRRLRRREDESSGGAIDGLGLTQPQFKTQRVHAI
ncbi:UNVERIFIED_CONTAM: hypothetical protein K2H54_014174 [Gekko kuhli]